MKDIQIMSRKEFSRFVDALIGEGSFDVEGVQVKGGKFVFGPLSSSGRLRLDYDVTILPPKKYLLPQQEQMMRFSLHPPYKTERAVTGKKRIILGVHPYDFVALRQTDVYYTDTHVDDLYVERRNNTIIIGLTPAAVSAKAFFSDMGTGEVQGGYDLFITDLGESYAIEVGTKEGEALLAKFARTRDANKKEIERTASVKREAASRARRGLTVPPSGWHNLLADAWTSDTWKIQADKCLSCGTCTIVCPTCFCYDVADGVTLAMDEATRTRTWDGCLLRDFTRVGSGEIFREKTEDRYRHRFFRKGRYLPDMLGFVACVGCGRCSSQCVPDIADPVSVFNMLAGSAGTTAEGGGTTPLPAERASLSEHGGPLYMPRPATLVRVERLTEWETLFEISMDDGRPLVFEPGQFVEVSVPGYGEAPFGISSAPGTTTFEIAVRKIGDVTTKMHAMKAGDAVGIRGPLGRGFGVDSLKGKDLLLVGAGTGLIPMRSLVNYVLGHRADFGKVSILYGCKRPCEVLFADDVGAWGKRDDVQFLKSVDKCPEGECWDGEIGLVTCLLPLATFDPASTVAVIVGPPIMYKFVIRDLKARGMPEKNIIVSLERRMKCGVGKCGHCQMNGEYVCKDGPVFSYAEIKDLPEAFT